MMMRNCLPWANPDVVLINDDDEAPMDKRLYNQRVSVLFEIFFLIRAPMNPWCCKWGRN